MKHTLIALFALYLCLLGCGGEKANTLIEPEVFSEIEMMSITNFLSSWVYLTKVNEDVFNQEQARAGLNAAVACCEKTDRATLNRLYSGWGDYVHDGFILGLKLSAQEAEVKGSGVKEWARHSKTITKWEKWWQDNHRGVTKIISRDPNLRPLFVFKPSPNK